METERTLSMNEMFPFWWYAAWRLFVTMFVITIIITIVQTFIPLSAAITMAIDWGIVLLGIVLQIFFLQRALNRTYRPYQKPAYRIGVTTVE